MNPLKLRINKKTWTIIILPNGVFSTKYGEDTLGITSFSENEELRCIYLRPNFKRDTVIHELVHVFIHSSDFGNPNHEVDDDEEAICELMGKHLDKIGVLADRIEKHYGRHKSR